MVAAIAILIGVVMAVYGFMTLPAEVATQFEGFMNTGAKRIPEIAAAVHANGAKVIANVNVVLAWQLGNVEPYVDALTLGYDTYPSAVLDVYFGRFSPVGKLPITMPKGDEVLAVNADGVCISPNDVPGYDKDQYMHYEMNFGLTY